jgi:hypothetical protein
MPSQLAATTCVFSEHGAFLSIFYVAHPNESAEMAVVAAVVMTEDVVFGI